MFTTSRHAWFVDGCVPALLELGWCLHDTTQVPEPAP
jgi:hypothetical protein